MVVRAIYSQFSSRSRRTPLTSGILRAIGVLRLSGRRGDLVAPDDNLTSHSGEQRGSRAKSISTGSNWPQPRFGDSMELYQHDRRSHSRTGCGFRANGQLAIRRLVSRAAGVGSKRQAHGNSHAVGHSTGAGTDRRGKILCHARRLPASRHSALLRMVRWAAGDLQVSRLGFRAGVGTMPRYPVTHQPGFARSLAHLRGGVSVRRTRRPCLGIRTATRSRQVAARGHGIACCSGGPEVQRQVPNGAPGGGPALQR